VCGEEEKIGEEVAMAYLKVPSQKIILTETRSGHLWNTSNSVIA
jgi:hypothetical protein